MIALLKALPRWIWRRVKALWKSVKPIHFRNRDWIEDLIRMRGRAGFKLVVDVGANKGQTTAEFLKLLPDAKIIAIEPLPDLARDLAALHLSNNRVTVCNCALGSTDGKKVFNAYAFDEASSFLQAIPEAVPSVSGISEAQVIEVNVKSIDTLMDELGESSLDILKLDAQGYEIHILNGASRTLTKIQAIYSEVLFGSIYKDQSEFWQIDQKLKQDNFWLFKIYHQVYGSDGRLLWADALWLNKKYFPN